MNRSEQLTRELYFVHKSGEHSVAYAVARIIALEELIRDLDQECMSPEMRERIDELVPDESTFNNDDPDSTEEETP